MKRHIFLVVFLIVAYASFAQTKYQELLVRNQRTYWATFTSLCHPVCNIRQVGISFDPNGLFDSYQIDDDNDTLPLLASENEVFISHRTYDLRNDTIFITRWSTESNASKTDEAYKILYLTDQLLVLLDIYPNGSGGWEDTYRSDFCEYNINVREFKRVKP